MSKGHLIKNIYVEITNICNLSCDFCPGHDRPRKHMSVSDFAMIAEKIKGKTENLFLHIMGEPLLHPELDKILDICDTLDVKLKITTNGTLLSDRLELLKKSKNLHTVCISVHSFDGNKQKEIGAFSKYMDACLEGARELAGADKFAVLRLWNLDGNSRQKEANFNLHVLDEISRVFPPAPDGEEWVENHRGVRVATHVFLEWGDRFEWPRSSALKPSADIENDTADMPETDLMRKKCHGLLTQVGILSDGSVVPCCLDRNGDITLGNIFESELEEILSSERAVRMKEAMAHHIFTEPLCKTCGFRR